MRKQIAGYPYIMLNSETYSEEQMKERSANFFEHMNKRRSIREFSNKLIPDSVLKNIIRTASTAPSGANKQPWTFCVIRNPKIKKLIREAAEQEEKRSYEGRMSDEWLDDLAPLGTNWEKPFLEIAPVLIVVCKRIYEIEDDGHKHQNYYPQESVGLACGLLLAAIHHAGLAALTHTPSPMNFLCKILQRPENEKAFLLIPVGYPADDCYVPDIHRKPIEVISEWYD